MIAGIGMDLVDIRRIAEMLAQHGERAKARLFSDGERAYADAHAVPAQHYAARFAAKEACYKALAGTEDARAIGWRDIEVVRDAHGIPSLRLHGRAAARAEAMGVTRLHLTLTHADGVAGAMVVAERG
ncbi:MAG: holo-ACP synthase [Gemmatimonadaceae bacterium]|nr:holo-ACP synthase [Gemmatimonadaceae bacterium]